MRFLKKVLCCVLAFSLVYTVVTNPKSPEQVANIASKNTVKIIIKLQNDDGKTGKALCSGVIIGPNKILTAGHCVDTNYKILNIWVADADGNSQPALILKHEKNLDLGLLGIAIPEKHWVHLGKKVRVGDSVVVVGMPLSLLWTATFGHISALNRTFKDSRGSYFQFDAPINGGNSGGGLWDMQGHLVGIVTMHMTPCFFGAWSGLGFAIDIKTIKEFIK